MAALYEQVAEAVHQDDRPVVLSGDCTTSLGTLTGLQRRGLDPAVVWFDAHGDLNTPRTSPSGYLGGMPLAIALGHGDRAVSRHLRLRRIQPEQVLLVDARDLDPGERELIAAAPIRHVPVGEVSTWLVPDGPVYLHVDLDVLDPEEIDGLRFPAPGGPSVGTVIEAIRTVMSTGRVVAVGIACALFPEHLDDQRTQNVLKAVLSIIEP
ncbi:MAG TPA: arginase family protein [Mycobacteriales bacterium]|nr:arginase family protein [Mycobacteriales bacterium]